MAQVKTSSAAREVSADVLNLNDCGRVAQLVEQCPFKAWVAGSSPAALTKISRSGPETWVTECTGYMGNTFGPKGFSSGSKTLVSKSKYPRSYCIKLTNQMSSCTSLMPTACPAKTWLKLIFLFPRQMRPQRVTTMVLSCRGIVVVR